MSMLWKSFRWPSLMISCLSGEANFLALGKHADIHSHSCITANKVELLVELPHLNTIKIS